MKLGIATQQNDEELKSFFNQQVVKGLYDYRVIRPNSFFDQYKLTSQDYQTFFLRNDDGGICAMASILFKKAYINHQEQTIAYVTDLRVSNSRKATLSWAKEFVPALEKAREERQCQFVFSDLEQVENKAYNLLLRRRNRNTRLPRYHLFRKFNLTVIYGKQLFAEEPLSAIKIELGQREDVEPLCQYLQTKSVGRPLRYNITPEELERRCREWPNFSMQNFLIAKNPNDKIIGCMAPWNNRDVQRYEVDRYHGQSQQVYLNSRALSPLRITRPLPSPGDSFKLKHVTHSAFDNPDIFYSLLYRAYEDCNNRELLVYPNYYGEYATRPPLSFISINIPYGFYTVLENEMRLPPYLHPDPFQPAPDFPFTFF